VRYYFRACALECGFIFRVKWEFWVKRVLGSGIGLGAMYRIDAPGCVVRPGFGGNGVRFEGGLRVGCGIGFRPDVGVWVGGTTGVDVGVVVIIIIVAPECQSGCLGEIILECEYSFRWENEVRLGFEICVVIVIIELNRVVL
jgi:hypothetical protein